MNINNMGKLSKWKFSIKKKNVFQFIFIIVLGIFLIYFFKNNGSQLEKSIYLIFSANTLYVSIAFFVTLIFLFCVGNIYKSAFEALNTSLPLKSTLIFSMKRNFVSVFLPAGGILSYALFTKEIENLGVSKLRIYFASLIYAASATTSLALITIPALVLLIFSNSFSHHFVTGFLTISAIVIILFLSFNSLFNRGKLYKMLSKYFPGASTVFDEFRDEHYSIKGIVKAISFSFIGETCGIIHLLLVSKALDVDISFTALLNCYAISTLTYALSPFMRGVGVVEITLTISLMSFGVPNISAISISLLYRFFTFWMPLIYSSLSFAQLLHYPRPIVVVEKEVG